MHIERLVSDVKEGDKEKLVSLVNNKKQEYYKLAYVYLNNHDDAQDALEDMIIKIFLNIKKLKKNESFYSWSKSILVNCCRRIIKQNKKTISLETVAKECKYNDVFGNKEDKILIDMYMAKLTLKQQEVIKLRYYLDLEYEEIAKLLKIPVGTVKSRIFNGMKKLKGIIGGEMIE